MKAAHVFMLGIGSGLAALLSGCAHQTVYVEHTKTAEQAMQGCVADIDPSKKPPQIMTYNTDTKLETHVQTYGDGAAMVVKDESNNKATGVDTVVGERPYSCNANGKDVSTLAPATPEEMAKIKQMKEDGKKQPRDNRGTGN